MKLRYVELPPSRIFNWLGPENVTALNTIKEWAPIRWDPEIVKLRNEFGRIWTEEFDKITQHFTLLEQSIRKKGILSPVSCVSGPPRDQFLRKTMPTQFRHPPEFLSHPNDAVYTQPFGGSRVSIAKKIGLPLIPCVVHDFSSLFPDAPEVTQRNFHKWFNTDYHFLSSTPYIRLGRHSHISNGRYGAMNQATRDAQRLAANRTKQRMGF